MITPPFPICCMVFNIGLVGPWSCDPFLAKAFPQVAAKLAMERIRKDPSINYAHQLDCTLCDEDCQTSKALAGFTRYDKHISAFIGPLNPGYCGTASLLGRDWNKAIFSWACVSDELDNPSQHPIFVRTLPSSAGILLAVLKYFRWAHVGIVFSKEDLWVDTANKLAIALRNRGLPVGVVTSTGKGDDSVEGTWAKIQAAGNIKVLILCMHSALIGGEDQATFLTKAQEMGLADGRYVFVPYDTLFYSLPYENHSYFILENDRTFREAYDAVLTITLQSGDRTFYEAFQAAKQRGEITPDLEPQQVSPLFGTIYDAIYLVAKAFAKAGQHETLEFSGTTLTQHVKNLDFASFSRRVQTDSKGRPLAKYVILDTDGKGSHLLPTYLLVTSSGLLQPLGRGIHFPGGNPLPEDSSCWFDPDVLCIRGLDPPMVILVLLPPLSLMLFGLCLAYLIRHGALYHQVLKGSKKLLLRLEDLTFVNTKFSRMRLTVDNLSDSKSNSEGRSLRSATHSLSVKSTVVTFETSNVAVYEVLSYSIGYAFSGQGDWVWLKKLEPGVIDDLRQNTTYLLSKMKDVRHENINPFFGLLSDGGLSAVVMEYCSRGSLEDLLQNTDLKLDWMFKSSLLVDLIKGMKYLHHQDLCHGRLKSRNCVVDGRFVLKITDYGYAGMLAAQNALCVQPPAEELLWTAPELLRDPVLYPKGTVKGDVYSFAIILQEVLIRGPPYCMCAMPAQEIIRKLKKPPPLYRPSVPPEDNPLECIQLMKQCWSEGPELRPTFDEIFEQVRICSTINKGKRTNIIDSMLRMLEQYSSNLEELIRDRTEELEIEKQKTEKLLTQMLPGSSYLPFFLLFGKNYTFDFQVETIGDAYMVASGLPKRNGQRHAAEIANMALDILSSVGSFKVKHLPGVPIRIRMGLHSGPCAAGVVGLTMPRYCLFGDTVNTASRIESTGLPFRIHISQSTTKTLRSLNEGYKIDFRGKTELKGKGFEDTYWLVGKKGFTKPLPHPPEMKPGQPWQDMIAQEIKSALKDSKRKFTTKPKQQH
ncbi:hypothetical protein JD844_033641 [Phrynosoma platyrhinos]|uniref:Guanylate cyclase n=1 Tax=Phrynosoma platyrhinos TaxID=52577 RepID=A0ABQ7T786_PHRPL|nr:hypothetical protein JD844_033641 [Phrynosoma platyrhinos]